MSYNGPNSLKPGEKFLACVWGPGSFHITKRKGFKTYEGAMRYAQKRIDDDPGVHEVVLLTKDKSNPDFPWSRLEVVQNAERARAREALKREQEEARMNRRRR